MKNITNIQSVILTAEQFEECIQTILEVREVILRLCVKLYGDNKYKKFRLELHSGALDNKISRKDRAQLERLRGAEAALVHHNIRLCVKLGKWYYCRSKHRMPGVDLGDFVQEAVMSVSDAVWSYDGSTKFVTYIYYAIRNRIKDFIRVDNPLSPPSVEILELGNTVCEHMGRTGCSLETAMIELKIPKNQHDNVRAVSASVISQEVIESESDLKGMRQSSLAECIADYRDSTIEGYDPMMMVALETADLNKMEREVFDAYLLNEKRYQTRIAKERGVSRQAVNHAFKCAKIKIQVRYFELCPSEAQEAA